MAPTTSISVKDIKRLEKELKEIRGFIAEIEKMGGQVPALLKKSLKHLQIAVNTGTDFAHAANEASKALKAYEKDLLSACKTVDHEMQMVCESKIDRKWQLRSVRFTLSYKNKDSVTARFIQKTIKRYTPSLICKHWDYCAALDKKTSSIKLPKKGDKVALKKDLIIKGNRHVKLISKIIPNKLMRGSRGVITAVEDETISVELEWYEPRDLALKIAKVVWGIHFK